MRWAMFSVATPQVPASPAGRRPARRMRHMPATALPFTTSGRMPGGRTAAAASGSTSEVDEEPPIDAAFE